MRLVAVWGVLAVESRTHYPPLPSWAGSCGFSSCSTYSRKGTSTAGRAELRGPHRWGATGPARRGGCRERSPSPTHLSGRNRCWPC